jgi:hypothetical protein
MELNETLHSMIKIFKQWNCNLFISIPFHLLEITRAFSIYNILI